MRKILITLVMSMLAVGCSSDGKFRKGTFASSVCGEQLNGFTMTAIHYGDSRLIVIPISKIEPSTEFRFLLVPKKRSATDIHDYDKVNVAISSADDDADASPDWLEVDGNLTDDGRILTLCVPATLGQSQYKYDVVVENVGRLDPRADVIIE